jgi:DNA protecting protein DprA
MNYTRYWMALDQAMGIGPASMMAIQEKLKENNLSVNDLFDLSPGDMAKEFMFNDKIIDGISIAKSLLPMVEKDYFALIDAGFDAILFHDPSYPARLHTLLKHNIPPILYIFGNKNILRERGAAILGDKDVSPKGEVISQMAAKDLSSHRIVTISGFAKGADMIAHHSALAHGGKTVAVLPYGMTHLKVPESIEDIFDGSRAVLVSPFYPTREYSQYNSYNRNRVIAALAYAVFIVEAPAEGGIFEAGKSANNIGTQLFVTEYSEYPANAAGNRRLIEEFGGQPVRGRKINDLLTPNLDKLIGAVKFSE